jgi:hypothetical protein
VGAPGGTAAPAPAATGEAGVQPKPAAPDHEKPADHPKPVDHEKPVKPMTVASAIPPGALLATPKPAAALPATGGTVEGGSVHLQLASVRSEAEAREEWRRLEGRYHDLLGGLSPSVVKADLGERGIYYRLRAGPLDEARAHALCEQLKSQNVGCQLARH